MIGVLLITGLYLAPVEDSALKFSFGSLAGDWDIAAFGVALVYVSYAYSEWNAAAYITEEFRSPSTNLPRSLIGGTLFVTVVYTLLQFVFLKHGSYADLAGRVDVGTVVLHHLFPENFARFFIYAIALLLISGISSMVWVGPRVTARMGEDYKIWAWFHTDSWIVPVRAIWLQAAVSIILILTGTFEAILIYCGVLLVLSSVMSVGGLWKVRDRYKGSFIPSRILGSAVWQIIFLIFSIWMLVFTIYSKPLESLYGLANVFLGCISWWGNQYLENNINRKSQESP